MGTGNGLADAVGDFRHHHALSAGDGYQVDSVASVIGLLHEGQRQGDTRAVFTTDVDTLAHVVVNAYYLIIYIVNADALAAGVATTWEQFLIGLLLDDAHLAVVTDIGLVDVSAVEHLRLVHALIVGHSAADADSGLAVAVVGGTAVREEQGRDDVELRDAATYALYVLVVHRPHTAFAEALVCFARGLRPHQGAIGGEASEILLEQLFQSVAATHQCHEHEHAPEDAKARQERTRLVACQGVEHLAVGV